MFRTIILSVIALALVLSSALVPASADDPKAKADPDAKYTIKLARERAGDETAITETEKGTSELTGGGQTLKSKQEKKLVYEEKIVEEPKQAGEKPVKLVRTYKTAQKYDAKAEELKALPFEGKTVTFEKKTGGYEFSIDGEKMADKDATELKNEFSGKGKSNIEELLPKNAVKVGESWTVDPAAVKSLADPTFPVDAKKSKITGKLTKAYTKDGKQWGVLAIDLDLVLDSNALKGEKLEGSTGSIKATGTLDVVIDGTARDGTMTMNFKMDVSTKELRVVADITQTKTLKTVKAGK